MLLILLLLCCVACGASEEVRVRSYLAETDGSLAELCKLGKELEALGAELPAQVKNDFSKPHLARVALGLEPRLQTLTGRGVACVQQLRSLDPPPSCRAYHEALMKLLDPFEKGMSSYARLTTEMKSGHGFSMTAFGGLLGEVVRSIETAQRAARRAQEERQKLLDEFHIEVGPDGLVR